MFFLACLILGLFLRVDALDTKSFSPDEGSYLYSAGVHRIDRSSSATAWIGEDLDWWSRKKEYPHSYLHQLVARYAYRAGVSSKLAIRLGSVYFGLLTGAVLYALYASSFPAKRWVGAVGGGLVALMCLHVWYSRTGWGTTSCTFFYAIYFALAWRMFQARTARGVALGGIGLALASLAAYGFHEMMSVYVVGMGLYVLVRALDVGADPFPSVGAGDPRRGLAGTARRLCTSPATWAYVLSAVPVGLLTLKLFFFSDFAQEHWFETVRTEGSPYLSTKLVTVRYLFRSGGGLDEQLSYPILALAAIGAVHLFRTSRRFFVFVIVNLCGSFLLFLLLFKDANLIRIHLPAAFLIALLAAEGVVALVDWIGASFPRLRPVALVGAGALLVLQPLVTRATVFGGPSDPFFQRSFHTAARASLMSEARAKEADIVEYLQEHLRGDETVRSMGYTPIFFLLDGGIDAVLFGRGAGDYVVGRVPAARKKLAQRFGAGRYEEVVHNPNSRWALYRRKSR